jgi:hypothetical protein
VALCATIKGPKAKLKYAKGLRKPPPAPVDAMHLKARRISFLINPAGADKRRSLLLFGEEGRK